MSPTYLGVEGQHCNVSLLASSVSANCISQNVLGLNERNYFGLSDCSAISSVPEDTKTNLNLKATELRLGLPGSQSPERDSDFSPLSLSKIDEKKLFPLIPSKDGICSMSQKTFVSGNKRGFSDTLNGFLEPKNSIKREMPPKEAHESNDTNAAPASKAQVVGWPPIRSFRKNTLAVNSKNENEVDGKPGPGALFVKVSMDGAPYLRKVDLRTYSTYKELSSALEQMFSCFIIEQCDQQGREMLSETKLRDLLNGSEYVLTFEDKDGDWMLVGDVPWDMFITSCKRLKIMKGSDAIGLAPQRAMEKSKNRN